MKRYILFLLLIGLIAEHAFPQIKYASIKGRLEFLKDGDSVEFVIHKYAGFWNNSDFQEHYFAKIHGHEFSIRMPIEKHPQYLTIDFRRLDKMEKDRKSLIAVQGDDIFMEEIGGRYKFTGTGEAKYNVSEKLEEIYRTWHPPLDLASPNTFLISVENEDKTATEKLKYLDSCKSLLAVDVYTLMRDNIISHNLYKGSFVVRTFTGKNGLPFASALVDYKPNKLLKGEIVKLRFDTANIVNTQFFLGGIINQYRLDSCLLAGKEFDIHLCYRYLKSTFHGIAREALVTWLIYDRRNSNAEIPALINDALGYITCEDFKNVLLRIESSRIKGAAAYDFRLADVKGNTRSLAEFNDKVVLLDFWYTGCPSCAQTAPYLARLEKQFEKNSVAFISICTDKNRNQWIKSIKDGLYTNAYTLNLYTGGMGKNHPVIAHYGITSFPGLILIDRTGKLCEVVGDPRNDNGKRLESLIHQALK
ncbi:MAG: hypothetical protein NVSMB24_27410 [Mucilaginibacter sp.]